MLEHYQRLLLLLSSGLSFFVTGFFFFILRHKSLLELSLCKLETSLGITFIALFLSLGTFRLDILLKYYILLTTSIYILYEEKTKRVDPYRYIVMEAIRRI